MKVVVIGTGYVGLVSGVCFAEIGHHVTCVDLDGEKIQKLKNAQSPIYEPGLIDLLERNLKSERLMFSTGYESVATANCVFLAVGTPPDVRGEANLDYLKSAVEAIAEYLLDDAIVVIKSTVPIGTHQIVKEMLTKICSKSISVINNPEFLKEGSAVDDFMKPDRVVIGHDNIGAANIIKELYAPVLRQGNPAFLMSNFSAELTKYAANALLAIKISFINEIAKLCDATGADIEEVRNGLISDRRIGPHFLYPGPGYGGSCFPKDIRALQRTAEKYKVELSLIKGCEEVNKNQKTYMFGKIINHFKGDLAGLSFAFWGVSFKANTDDIRESAAIYLARKLVEVGAEINFYDPVAMDNFYGLMESDRLTKGKTHRFQSKYDCLNGASGLITMTEWREFTFVDFDEVKKRLKKSVIFDGRNLFKTDKVLREGIEYYAVGKKIPRIK
jgi:UDPglucose 6-dehydrogenase